MHPDDADLIPKSIESIAWSYIKEGIKGDQIPVKPHFCTDIRVVTSKEPAETGGSDDVDIRLRSLPDNNDTTTKQRTLASRTEYCSYDRQLGIDSTIDGNVHEASKHILRKTNQHLKKELKFFRLHGGRSIATIANMLLSSVPSYIPLLQDLDIKALTTIDQAIWNAVASSCGLTNTDSRSPIFMKAGGIGIGVRSITTIHLFTLARKLEVHLNNNQHHAIAMHSRFKAYSKLWQNGNANNLQHIPNAPNYVGRAIKLLGHFGVYISDNCFCVFNLWMNTLAEKKGIHPIGHENCNDSGPHIGRRRNGPGPVNMPVEESSTHTFSNMYRAGERTTMTNTGLTCATLRTGLSRGTNIRPL